MRQKIKDIVAIQIGHQFRGKIEPLPEGSHQVVQIKDFDGENQLNTSSLFRITPKSDVERYLINKGDVLFLSRGQRNFAYPIISEMGIAIAAGYFFILRIKSGNILPEYLAWYINQVPAQRYLQNRAKRGTHMPIIGKSEFEQMKIDIPEIKIQRMIIKVSELQKKESRLRKALQNKRSALLQGICLKAVRQD